MTVLTGHAQSTWFVLASATGTNNGSSWINAFTDVQDAIDNAAASDSIFIGKGTYYPTSIIGGSLDPRDKAFLLKNALLIYGGFAGTESNLMDRSTDSSDLFLTNVSVLSGDLGNINDSSDNCFHVIIGVDLDSTSTLDGLQISHGNADGTDSIVVAGKSIFRYFGGGFYISHSEANMNLLLFKDNLANLGGAGLNNFSSNSSISSTSFANNVIWGDEPGDFGGAGMRNVNSNPELNFINFFGNKAYSIQGGGGMRNENGSPSITNAYFLNNYHETGDGGAGMYNAQNSNPEIINSIFENNTTLDQGGGMYSDNSNPSIYGSRFEGNVGINGAGAMENDGGSNAHLNDVSFLNNHTDADGGAIQNWMSSPILENVKFVGNSSNGNGGGLFNYNTCSPIMVNVIFENNSTSGNGGAIYNRRNCHPIVTNTLIIRNSAGNLGGGTYTAMSNSSPCSPIFTNVTVANNTADSAGGGGYDDGAGSPKMRNSIVHGNHAPSNPDIFIPVTLPSNLLLNSIISNDFWSNGTSSVPFTSPVFVDTTSNTLGFQLHASSYAIDRGDSSVFNGGKTPDLSNIVDDLIGFDRIMGGNIDLGVYEDCPTLIPEVTITADPDSIISYWMTVIFTAHPQNAGTNPIFSWYLNSQLIIGATSPTYTTTSGQLITGDKIYAEINSTDKCASVKLAKSNTITMTVYSGLNDHSNKKPFFTLYPNPNNGIFSIQGMNYIESEYKIEVMDVGGRVLYSTELFLDKGKFNALIDVPMKLNAGLYFVNLKTENNQVRMLKFSVE